MIITPSINKDNPLVAKDTTCRNQFKDEEICAVATINNVYRGPIKLDSLLISYLLYDANASLVQQIKSESLLEVFDIDYITSTTKEKSGRIRKKRGKLRRRSSLAIREILRSWRWLS